MKSLVDLLALLVLDCARLSDAPVVKDIETLRRRAEDEGDSFITITLPTFCRDFEKSLDVGQVAPGSFLSFGKKRSGIPEFLQGFLRHVFDSDGKLVDVPSIDCIRSVRQICLFGKKIERECSPERLNDAMAGYVKCDNEVVAPDCALYEVFKKVANIIIDASDDLKGDSFIESLRPKHGPRATQEKLAGNQKWYFGKWHDRLTDVGFGWLEWGLGSLLSLRFGDVEIPFCNVEPPDFVEFENEAPVRVVFVPKTQKSPRVIAVEPVCMQYAQQALRGVLYGSLNKNRYTAGHVNFRDQTVNQALAKACSGTGHLATLDMSDASDRVGLTHVFDCFHLVPRFRDWVFASRSHRAELPNGDLVSLKKFASMGSALCFPIEALVFFMSILASRLSRANVNATTQTCYWFSRDVFVYGDDLIVPADEASMICDDLETLGFKVNRNKSFWTGKFRESCGVDCFDNQEVTPVYLRRDLPSDQADVSGILSAVSTANQLHSAGLWLAAAAIRKAVEQLLGETLPQVPEDGPAVGWNHYSETVPARRFNTLLQRFESLNWVVVAPVDPDPLDGVQALAKCFVKLEDSSPELLRRDRKTGYILWNDLPVEMMHLEESTRLYSLTLKRRWVPVQ